MNPIDWILTHGDGVLFWALTALVALAATYVVKLSGNATVQGILRRAVTEIGDAVLAVGKVYVEALKKASEDGQLTDQEKAEAKAKALALAKSNLGKAGLARLAKVIGADVDLDTWLMTKIESAVSQLGGSKVAVLSAVEPVTAPVVKPATLAVVPADPQ